MCTLGLLGLYFRVWTGAVLWRIKVHARNTEARIFANGIFIVFQVSEKGYENCESEDTKPIGMCQSPFSKAITTIVFREYSPLPNGIDYRPGQTYYFICKCFPWHLSKSLPNTACLLATSDGTEAGLHNKNGGLCAKANMRLKVKIAPRDEEGAAETVEPKSGASSMDGRGISTQDDPDGESAISKSGASSAIRKQYATGRRQLTSDTKTTISDTVDGESSNEEAEDKDSIGINFVVDDNKLQPTPLAASAGKNAQLDGSTGALVYDPYGLEPSNSVKRDRQSSESWRNTKGRPGRYQPVEDKSFILYEIHESKSRLMLGGGFEGISLNDDAFA